jgi:transcriptional regulator with XRE-family HTH domain
MTEARTRPIATIEQIRAARALLGWSQGELAHHAGLSQTGIARIENGTNRPNTNTLDKILRAFDREDVELIGTSGVKKRTGEIRTLQGRGGFADFLDDVAETLKEGGESCIFHGNAANWLKWADQSQIDAYYKKMVAIKDKINVRVIIGEGDTFCPATSYGAQYRYVPKHQHDDHNVFSCYGDKLALSSFSEKDVVISIIHKAEFVKAYKALFDAMWNVSKEVNC